MARVVNKLTVMFEERNKQLDAVDSAIAKIRQTAPKKTKNESDSGYRPSRTDKKIRRSA